MHRCVTASISIIEKHNEMLVKILLGQFSLCIAHIEPISISAAAPTAPIKSAHMNSVNPAMFQIFQHNHHKNYQIRSFEAKSQLGNRNNHMITITTHKHNIT